MHQFLFELAIRTATGLYIAMQVSYDKPDSEPSDCFETISF